MIRSNTFLTAEEQQQVTSTIAALEKETSAELVCAISTESARYDRAESTVGLIAAVVFLAAANVLWVALTDRSDGPDGWSTALGLPFMFQLIAVVIGFISGSVAASYYHLLRRPLVIQKQRDAEVNRAAAIVFNAQRLHTTRHSAGVLIYLSLFEHRVVVLADAGAMKALDQSILDSICAEAAASLKAGKRLDSILTAIATLKPLLTKQLPIEGDNIDELPNQLICIHPRP